MGNPLVPLFVGTGIYAALFIILPILIRRGPNQGIIRSSILIAVFSMWIFWATVYIAQMKPIVGPRHRNTTLIWMRHKQGAKVERENATINITKPEKVKPQEGRRFNRCSKPPDNLFQCCNIPWLPSRAVTECIKHPINALKLTCGEAICAFSVAGWTKRTGLVTRKLVEAYYDYLVQIKPEWAEAVNLIKTQCLTSTPKYQGIYTNCIEFDIMYCSMTRMFKHGPIVSWSSSPSCLSAKQFLATCPLCPDACKNQSPSDSDAACHACLTL